jgi:anti-anti-sigma regulatory factor
VVAVQAASKSFPQHPATAGTVTVSDHDGIGSWLVALHGEHDLSTLSLLEDDTTGILDHCTRVVVDLSNASFIDCSVLNWLWRMQRTLEAAGRQSLLVVDGARGSTAARAIDAAGVRDSFAFYPTRRAAFAEWPMHAETGDDRWARARRRPNGLAPG